jgi:hypothetical protein
MTNDTKLEITFGRRSFPDNVRAVWGARLIFPADLVHDRQDLAAHDDEAKAELIRWLNGADDTGRNGAIAKMLDVLRDTNRRYEVGIYPRMKFEQEAVIYEDDEGKIVGSDQASGGHLYVCGWLKEHVG